MSLKTQCIIRNTNKVSEINFQTLFLQSEKQKENFISLFAVRLSSYYYCGSSSFGRARPCQGRGGRFEPGLPLTKTPARNGSFFLLLLCLPGLFAGEKIGMMPRPGGETGRHAGLKILFAAMQVTVQFRSGAQSIFRMLLFYAAMAKLVDALP